MSEEILPLEAIRQKTPEWTLEAAREQLNNWAGDGYFIAETVGGVVMDEIRNISGVAEPLSVLEVRAWTFGRSRGFPSRCIDSWMSDAMASMAILSRSVACRMRSSIRASNLDISAVHRWNSSGNLNSGLNGTFLLWDTGYRLGRM